MTLTWRDLLQCFIDLLTGRAQRQRWLDNNAALRAQLAGRLMPVRCQHCDVLLRYVEAPPTDDPNPVSHGICQPCYHRTICVPYGGCDCGRTR